jgi:hypothetical protein
MLALAAMLALSFSLRKNDFIELGGSQNLEASYHVLLTVRSLDQNPVENHFFLPIVSLGSAEDKQIPWGATVPTKNGDYIYTSFNFPGFVAPYLWFKIFSIEQSATNLAYFNVLLGCICSIMLLALCYSLLRLANYDAIIASIAALSACTVSIFSREALLSHGLTYWAQSLYQVILAASLIAIYKFLTCNSARTAKIAFYSVVFLFFIGALTEWTGYILSVGLALLLWSGSEDNKEHRKLAVYILIATMLSGLITVIHFSAVVGFRPEFDALLGRFLARSASASAGSITGLIQGYGLSYGLFLLLVVGISVVSGFTRQPEIESKNSKILLFIFLASCIPTIENLVMLQHAMMYSFDRLKFIFPAAIIFAFCFARSNLVARALLLVALIFASSQGYKSYRADLADYSSWAEIDKSNKVLAEKVKPLIQLKCTVFASNIQVRGYANLLFNHGIYEGVTLQTAEALLQQRKGCELVYIEGIREFPGLPKYSKATIRKESGQIEIINSGL